MTWEDILKEIKRILQEPETGGFWSDEEYLRKANIVQNDVAQKLKCFKATTTLTVDSETWMYNRPDKCWQIIKLTYNGKQLTGKNTDQLDKDYELTNIIWRELEGEPRNYIADSEEMDSIVLFPNPKDASAVVKITYITGCASLTGTSSVPFDNKKAFQDAYQLIIDGVVYRCFMSEGNDRYKEYKKEYTEGLIMLKNQLNPVDELDTFNIGSRG